MPASTTVYPDDTDCVVRARKSGRGTPGERTLSFSAGRSAGSTNKKGDPQPDHLSKFGSVVYKPFRSMYRIKSPTRQL